MKELSYGGLNQYGDVNNMPFTMFKIHSRTWMTKGEFVVPWIALPS
jgi:hypothetical protein